MWVTSSRPDWVSTHQTALLVRICVKARKTNLILYFSHRSNHRSPVISDLGSPSGHFGFAGALSCLCALGEQSLLWLSHNCSTHIFLENQRHYKSKRWWLEEWKWSISVEIRNILVYFNLHHQTLSYTLTLKLRYTKNQVPIPNTQHPPQFHKKPFFNEEFPTFSLQKASCGDNYLSTCLQM